MPFKNIFPRPIKKNILHVLILYFLALTIIFSYIPFNVQSITHERDGSFILSTTFTEFSWFNPPPETETKTICGIDWNKLYTEILGITIIAGITFISKFKND